MLSDILIGFISGGSVSEIIENLEKLLVLNFIFPSSHSPPIKLGFLPGDKLFRNEMSEVYQNNYLFYHVICYKVFLQ